MLKPRTLVSALVLASSSVLAAGERPAPSPNVHFLGTDGKIARGVRCATPDASPELRRLYDGYSAAVLPALGTPTISTLADQRWVAINTVVEERLVTELCPKLSEAGARAIVEYPLNKIIE